MSLSAPEDHHHSAVASKQQVSETDMRREVLQRNHETFTVKREIKSDRRTGDTAVPPTVEPVEEDEIGQESSTHEGHAQATLPPIEVHDGEDKPHAKRGWRALDGEQQGETINNTAETFTWGQWFYLIGYMPFTMVAMTVGAHAQPFMRDGLAIPSETVGKMWAFSNIVCVVFEIFTGLTRWKPTMFQRCIGLALWALSYILIWQPRMTLAFLPSYLDSWVLLLLICIHTGLHAFWFLNYSSSFSLLFPDKLRARAASLKQLFSTGGLIGGMVVFPRVMGHQWTNFGEASIVALVAAVAFLFTGGVCINFVIFRFDEEPEARTSAQGSRNGDTDSPAVHSQLSLESDFRLSVIVKRVSTVFGSLYARSFLMTEFLASISHMTIMAGFPLFCKHAADTGMLPRRIFILGRFGVTLGARDQIPLLYGVLYFAATCSGFVWAYLVRSKILSPTMTWRVSSSLYATALIWLMSATSLLTAAVRVLFIGVSMSAFLILPEMLLGRAVDDLRAADKHYDQDPNARAQVLARSVTLVKQMVRRVAGVIQGVLVGYVLSYSGYREGALIQTDSAVWAITVITCLVPAVCLTLSGLPMKYISDKEKENENRRSKMVETGAETMKIPTSAPKDPRRFHSDERQRKFS